MPDLELNDTTALTQESFPVFFKHKLAASFRVGPHQFADHIYQINSADAYNDFMREFDGLLEIDQVNLTQIMNIQNERPIEHRKVIRGSQSVSQVNASELASASERQGELDRREAIVNQRFAEIGHIDEIQTKLDAALAALAVAQAGQGTSSASQSVIPEAVAPVVQPVDAGLDGEPASAETDAADKNANGDTDESKPATAPATKLGGLRLG